MLTAVSAYLESEKFIYFYFFGLIVEISRLTKMLQIKVKLLLSILQTILKLIFSFLLR